MSTLIRSLFVVILILFSSNFCFAQLSKSELIQFKQQMIKAIESDKLTDSLSDVVKKLPNKNALMIGYEGTLEALKAKHAWNPYHKIKYVSRSIKTMQLAINKDPENLEIRFMRFSIQHFTPGFLGFSKNLNEDRREIVKHYQNHTFADADEALVKNIAKFMIESKRCSASEIEILKKKL